MGVAMKMVKRADLDWENLPFDFNGTDAFIRAVHRAGQWSPLEVVSGVTLTMHIAAGIFHYCQSFFEGLTVDERPDGSRWILRPGYNAQRFCGSAEIMAMPLLPVDMFMEAVQLAANANRRLQPPPNLGASLYIRPFMFASGSQLGVRRSSEHTFICYATPVGPYFPQGFTSTISVFLTLLDRVAPAGTGNAKGGANYAQSIRALEEAQAQGCQAPLFTQPPHHTIITETHASNFGCVIDNIWITPEQSSFILASNTREVLFQICQDLDIPCQRSHFLNILQIREMTEAMGMGTGAIIAPIGKFKGPDGSWLGSKIDPSKPGEISRRLYEELIGIKRGTVEDKHGWMHQLPN